MILKRFPDLEMSDFVTNIMFIYIRYELSFRNYFPFPKNFPNNLFFLTFLIIFSVVSF